MNYIKHSAKELIAGNFANFHRYGWEEVACILQEKRYFRHQQDIRKDLQEALKNKSVELLNSLMTKYNIVSLYTLPTTSKL